jgi:hypothetical protein
MKGIAITSILAIGGILILVALVFSMFTGGATSSGLFGWQGTVLEGVESFFTGIYNIMVVISSWVTIGILFTIFLAVQGAFIFLYYQLFRIAQVFKPALEKFLDSLAEV